MNKQKDIADYENALNQRYGELETTEEQLIHDRQLLKDKLEKLESARLDFDSERKNLKLKMKYFEKLKTELGKRLTVKVGEEEPIRIRTKTKKSKAIKGSPEAEDVEELEELDEVDEAGEDSKATSENLAVDWD